MPSVLRMKRINDRIKEIISMVLLAKIEDPRLLGVTVTDVKVDRELDYANIYVSAIEGEQRAEEVLDALKHARGFCVLKFHRKLTCVSRQNCVSFGTPPRKGRSY